VTSDRFIKQNADQTYPSDHDHPKIGSSLSSTQLKPDLLSLTFGSLKELVQHLGISTHHAAIIFRGLHKQNLSLDQIPQLGRHVLTLTPYVRRQQLTLQTFTQASDGTIKLLFKLMDGHLIESVLLPMRRERFTLCISTQVGCAMGCSFCATGMLKLSRSLTAGEIVSQVYAARVFVDRLDGEARRLSHLVFMGMGEPLHCYESTRDAVRILIDQRGISLAAHKITVSTVGLVPAIHRFYKDFQGKVPLALSLHAGTDETRRQIIPVARKWSLKQLKTALLTHPLPKKSVIMLEYVVLPGVNDTEDELDGVARFYQGLRALVNLIPFNPFPQSRFRSPTHEEVDAVDQKLKLRGVPCSMRIVRGRERSGACGQLARRGFE